jgi:hypothetical protein
LSKKPCTGEINKKHEIYEIIFMYLSKNMNLVCNDSGSILDELNYLEPNWSRAVHGFLDKIKLLFNF